MDVGSRPIFRDTNDGVEAGLRRSVSALRPGWLLLAGGALRRDAAWTQGLDAALIHADTGIALLGTEPSSGAVDKLKHAFDAAGLPDAFGGYPPIVYRVLPPPDLPLEEVLDEAFEIEPAIALSNGAGWTRAAQDVLAGTASDAAAALPTRDEAPPHEAPPPSLPAREAEAPTTPSAMPVPALWQESAARRPRRGVAPLLVGGFAVAMLGGVAAALHSAGVLEPWSMRPSADAERSLASGGSGGAAPEGREPATTGLDAQPTPSGGPTQPPDGPDTKVAGVAPEPEHLPPRLDTVAPELRVAPESPEPAANATTTPVDEGATAHAEAGATPPESVPETTGAAPAAPAPLANAMGPVQDATPPDDPALAASTDAAPPVSDGPPPAQEASAALAESAPAFLGPGPLAEPLETQRQAASPESGIARAPMEAGPSGTRASPEDSASAPAPSEEGIAPQSPPRPPATAPATPTARSAPLPAPDLGAAAVPNAERETAAAAPMESAPGLPAVVVVPPPPLATILAAPTPPVALVPPPAQPAYAMGPSVPAPVIVPPPSPSPAPLSPETQRLAVPADAAPALLGAAPLQLPAGAVPVPESRPPAPPAKRRNERPPQLGQAAAAPPPAAERCRSIVMSAQLGEELSPASVALMRMRCGAR